MARRGKLIEMVTWKLGDGNKCAAMGQPWFMGAVDHIPQTSSQKHLLVKDLVQEDTGTWNADQLLQLFGYTGSMSMLSSMLPPTQNNQEDLLIFKPSANGQFSVKKAYDLMRNANEHEDLELRRLWRNIWKKRNILPRLRLFLWKCVNGALPLGKILFSRMARGDPIYATCREAEDNITDMLFTCPFSRACWFTGSLTTRSQGLVGNITEIMRHLIEQTSQDQWTISENMIWAIWRCRNEMAYSDKRPTPKMFQKFLAAITTETMLALSGKPK